MATETIPTDVVDKPSQFDVLDEVFATCPLGETAIELKTQKSPSQLAIAADNSLSAMMAVRSTLRTSQPVEQTDWWDIAWKPLAFSLAIFGIMLIYRSGLSLATGRARATLASQSSQRQPAKKLIGEARCGDRLMGRNPFREQADLVEPDPETWRKISLLMTKESGSRLWVELLRSLTWIDDEQVEVGGTIHLDLPEMGAVGEAEVTAIGPCPKIEPETTPGTTTVVTGTFRHETDENTRLVELRIDGQAEAVGVTDNHPYWSVTRREYVEVGKLHIGEFVDTKYGARRVVSITPKPRPDFLYNLETTEHVFRVGSLGTLVHNSCVVHGKPQHTSAAHAKAMQDMADRMAKSGAYSDVYMHSKWTTILQGKGVSVSPNQLPDVAGIRLDGKIDIIEFASSAKDFKYGNLLGRNRDIWKQLPKNLRVDILVYDELGNWTQVFP